MEFKLGDQAKIARTGEAGTVEGLANYRTYPSMAWLKYRQADGRAGEGWFELTELEAA